MLSYFSIVSFSPFVVRPIVLAIVLVLAVGCGGGESGGRAEIETVDVRPSRTSVLTTAYDEAAPERREAFSGVLPSDFPGDLPLYDPSNLTDFGREDGRFVLLFSPDAATMVRDRMRAELARSGWTLIDGAAERGTWRRGSQSVVIAITDARPGTEIRIQY